jgi:hypothetical protein
MCEYQGIVNELVKAVFLTRIITGIIQILLNIA